MNTVFNISDTATNKISYYHLACFLILLPFDFFYSQLVLVSFALHTLMHCTRERLQELLSITVLLPVVIYIVSVITISYSIDKAEGFNIAGRQTAIFFMPVLLTLNGLPLQEYKKKLLTIFAITCTVVIMYLYADAVYTILYFHMPLSSLMSTAFINHNFSLPVELHATYLSLYAAFSICICIYYFLKQRIVLYRLLYALVILILTAGLIQLTSRAVVIAFIVIITIAVPVFLLRGKTRTLFAIMALLIAYGSFYFISKIDVFKTRYVSELNNDLTKAAISDEILEPRITRWHLAATLIKKSPFIGYGTGSEKILLKEQYFNNKLYISYLNEFNVHSEYLSFMLRSGIAGLLIYLIVLGYGFVLSVRKKDFLFFSFLLLVAMVSVSENILDVNKGVFFYSFFLSFFLKIGKKELLNKGNSATN